MGMDGTAYDDEAFWRRNQRFLTERMGQPCCTLAGTARLLAQMTGDFAVVVHGEDGCLDSFPLFEGGVVADFYCTRITEAQFASGKTGLPLRRCLEAVAAQRRPKLVFVLGTCLIEMSRADIEDTCAAVSAASGVPILPLRTHGLKAGSQAEYTDALYERLASLPLASVIRPKGAAETRVDLFGLPRLNVEQHRELSSVLAEAGIRLGSSFPHDASLEAWRGLRDSSCCFVVDSGLYPKLLERLKHLRIPVADAPLPVGLTQSLGFFRTIGRRLEVPAAMDRALRGASAGTGKRLRRFRAEHGGLRVAAGLRMANFGRTSQLALDGLAELEALRELGMKLTLLIQGPPEAASREYFRARLRALGCALPFKIFAEPNRLPEMLEKGGFDAAFMADHGKGYADQAGIPHIDSRSLEPFFSGAIAGIDRIEDSLKRRSR